MRWPPDPVRRCLVVGAIAGVVLEIALVGGVLGSRWLPEVGLEPPVHRTIELLPFVAVGGAAFLMGVGAFGLALWLTLSGGSGHRRRGGRRTSPR